MRFSWAAALLSLLLAAGVAGCNLQTGLLSSRYEYEEDLSLRLDGSATLVVNASIPALVALRGFTLDTSPRARLDRLDQRIRELYTSPYAEVVRIADWTRSRRRFVGVRLKVADVRMLSNADPFSWATYVLEPANGQHVFKVTLRGSTAARAPSDVGLTGNEVVAFRIHLPSHIRYHNARDLETDKPRSVQRGNIVIWEQRLSDRLQGKPLQIEVRMDRESILYRTLWLFGLAFVAAVAVLLFLIWLTMRRGRSELVPEPPISSAP